ncbi:hypothetical protein CCMA1212_006471 [Trichoderma ghanense]|uniref:Uncharacterized protein n=1 Tax=Trichoderma ghanense TaxID=65468 RepID=A0ABY2H233_9HYPO
MSDSGDREMAAGGSIRASGFFQAAASMFKSKAVHNHGPLPRGSLLKYLFEWSIVAYTSGTAASRAFAAHRVKAKPT